MVKCHPGEVFILWKPLWTSTIDWYKFAKKLLPSWTNVNLMVEQYWAFTSQSRYFLKFNILHLTFLHLVLFFSNFFFKVLFVGGFHKHFQNVFLVRQGGLEFFLLAFLYNMLIWGKNRLYMKKSVMIFPWYIYINLTSFSNTK